MRIYSRGNLECCNAFTGVLSLTHQRLEHDGKVQVGNIKTAIFVHYSYKFACRLACYYKRATVIHAITILHMYTTSITIGHHSAKDVRNAINVRHPLLSSRPVNHSILHMSFASIDTCTDILLQFLDQQTKVDSFLRSRERAVPTSKSALAITRLIGTAVLIAAVLLEVEFSL